MNTQPQPLLADATGQALLSDEIRVTVIQTTGSDVKLRITLPDAGNKAPYYEPKGNAMNGLRLTPRFVENNGVAYKVDKKGSLTLPNKYAATHKTKRPVRVRPEITPEGVIVLPSLTLVDREPKNVVSRSKPVFGASSVSTKQPNKADASAADVLENRFISAVKFVNNNRKVVKAKLHLNASGDLLAQITKVMFVK